MSRQISLVVLFGFFSFLIWHSAWSATEDAKELYLMHCKACHAADGSGKKASGEWLGIAKMMKLDSLQTERLSLLTKRAREMDNQAHEDAILSGIGKMKGMKRRITVDEAKRLVDYTRVLQKSAK